MHRPLIALSAAVSAVACSGSDARVGPLAPAPYSSLAADERRALEAAGSGDDVLWWLATASDAEEVDAATMVVRMGGDTIAVERFSRIGRTLTGQITRRDHTLDYTLVLGPDDAVRRMETRITPAGGTTPAQRFWATFRDDSVHTRTLAGTRTTSHASVLPPHTLPYLDPSTALLELIVRQARRRDAREVTVPVLVLGDPSVVQLGIVRLVGRDSVHVTFGEVTTRLHIDRQGRILGGAVPERGARFDRAPGGAAASRAALRTGSGAH